MRRAADDRDSRHRRVGNGRSTKGTFSVTESFPLCGEAGEEQVVRRANSNGTTVAIAVNYRDGVKHGFRLLWRKGGTRRTFIDLRTRHLSLRNVLRVARGLSRVTPTVP